MRLVIDHNILNTFILLYVCVFTARTISKKYMLPRVLHHVLLINITSSCIIN